MTDVPPRLESTSGSQPGYAPISWAAVASVIAVLIYVVVLGLLAIFSFIDKQPLIAPWLLIFPALAVLFAFTARRQILNSEGTRTGEKYATYAWWFGILGGLGYAAYLGGIEFSVRRDAEQQFIRFAEVVKKIDPANPRDPNVYDATIRMVAPGQRNQIRNPKNPADVERVLKEELLRFRQLDMTRIVGRNRETVEFTNFGVKDWQQTPGKITCTLTCKMITPEGEHSLVVPMQAVVDQRVRQWQVSPSQSGYVQSEMLTRYGWFVRQVEESGREFVMQFLTVLSLPEQAPTAYVGFVEPKSNIQAVGDLMRSAFGRAALAGAPASLSPTPPNYEEVLNTKLFAQPDDSAPSPSDLARFRDCWNNGRFGMAGFTLRDTPDVNPVLRLTDDGVEMSFPIELYMGGQASGMAARGKLLIRAIDPALRKDLTQSREQKSALSPTKPMDLSERAIPWRVIRITSDLRAIKPSDPFGPPDQQ